METATKGVSMSIDDGGMEKIAKMVEDFIYLEECEDNPYHGMVIADIRVLTATIAAAHLSTYEKLGYDFPVGIAYDVIMGKHHGLTFNGRATPEQIESFSKLPVSVQKEPLMRLVKNLNGGR